MAGQMSQKLEEMSYEKMYRMMRRQITRIEEGNSMP
jgi:hypothetical protein